MVAIWSTLGLAGALAEWLGGRGLLGVAFGLGFVVTLGAIAAGALGRRPSGRDLWALTGIAAAYGMVVVRMGVADRTHLFEYGLLAVLVHQALDERRRGGRRVPAPAVLAILLTGALGWLDEGIQARLPGRVYHLRDVVVNVGAGALAVSAGVFLRWLRR